MTTNDTGVCRHMLPAPKLNKIRGYLYNVQRVVSTRYSNIERAEIAFPKKTCNDVNRLFSVSSLWGALCRSTNNRCRLSMVFDPKWFPADFTIFVILLLFNCYIAFIFKKFLRRISCRRSVVIVNFFQVQSISDFTDLKCFKIEPGLSLYFFHSLYVIVADGHLSFQFCDLHVWWIFI